LIRFLTPKTLRLRPIAITDARDIDVLGMLLVGFPAALHHPVRGELQAHDRISAVRKRPSCAWAAIRRAEIFAAEPHGAVRYVKMET
jgi:hypothetical protein